MANPKSGNDAKGLMTVDAGASGNVGVTRMGWTASWTPTAGMSVLIAS